MRIQTVFLFLTIMSTISAQKNFTAGEIQSRQHTFHYGRYEMMMYSSDVSGTTSTFFLWKDRGYESNVYWNEIDIETFGKSPNEWQSNPIWQYNNSDQVVKRWEEEHSDIPIANTWVKFTLEWTPSYIAWFNNDVEVRRIVLGQNVPPNHFRYNNGDSRDPVQYIRDPMRVCFNHWASYPGEWLGPWNPADLPSFQFVDWFTYQPWNGSGFDPVSIRYDFNTLSEVTSAFTISNHTFDENQCDFVSSAVGVVNGHLWLGIFSRGQERAPAGNELPPSPPSNNNPQSGTNFIANGEFNNGTMGWNMQYNNASAGTFTVVTNQNMSGTNAARICPTTPGTANWHVQLRHNAPFQAGKHYEIAFIAKASAARTIGTAIQMEGDPWETYWEEGQNLTTVNQRFSYIFSPTVSDATALLKFYFGTNATCAFIDSVVYKEIPSPPPPPATITAAGPTTFCAGGNVILNANTGTGYTYQWLRNNTNITGATAASYTATQAGSYTVRVTAHNLSTTSTATTVTVNALPATPTATANTPLCAGATLNLTTPALTGATYAWTGPGGYTATTQNPTRTNVTTAMAGTYSVTRTVNGCNSAAGTVAVTVHAIPGTPTVISPITYEQNQTASPLTASGSNLLWYTHATTGTGSATAPIPSTATVGTVNYYVSQTVQNCESSRAHIEVIIQEAIVTQSIELQEGWNLISVSVLCSDVACNVSTVFENVDVAMVKNTDGFWKPNQPEPFNSLHTIEPGKGYLVYMNMGGTIQITGTPSVQTPNLGVCTGWQLIGYPCSGESSFAPMPISDYFNATNAEIIKNFDGFWQPNGTTNSIQNFEVGKGYWLKR